MAKAEVYNVHGVLYQVVETDENIDYGEIDREAGLIKIARKLAPSVKMKTKQHELSHAAFWESGTWHRLEREFGQRIADDVDEHIADVFTPVLFNIKRVK